MTLWRVSNYPTLDGAGGLLAAGRWHSRGRRVVYCATTPAGALLEMIAHLELELDEIPESYRLLRVDGATSIARERVDEATLAPDWRDLLPITQRIGSAWLESGRTALLEVPSALVPAATNVLINPLHPDARRLVVAAILDVPLDRRLLR